MTESAIVDFVRVVFCYFSCDFDSSQAPRLFTGSTFRATRAGARVTKHTARAAAAEERAAVGGRKSEVLEFDSHPAVVVHS